MQAPVAHGADFRDVLDDSVSLVRDELYDELDGFLVGRAGELVGELLLACGLMLDGRILQSDSFHDAHCENVLVVPVVYLVFCR